MESRLPYNEAFFPLVDAYIESLTAFTSDAFFRQLTGGVHILDFFTASPNLYDSILPLDWRQYFDNKSIEDILDLLIKTDLNVVHPNGIPDSLYEFIRAVQRHELRRGFAKPQYDKAEEKHTLNRRRRLAAGMSDKKLHEVEHFAQYLSKLVNSLVKESRSSITHLVDFGSGQSYLSRILASPPHNLDLVAVESKGSNIEAGKALDAKVGLGPNPTRKSLTQRAPEEANQSESPKKGSITYVQHMIHDESMKAVLGTLESSIPSEGGTDTKAEKIDPGLMIISLHSCGNLIHHALNSLLYNNEVKAVAVIGCCYNLMTERAGPSYKPPYSKSSTFSPYTETDSPSTTVCNHHFPLSTQLSSLSTTLNITSRMMACQAPRNWTPETSSSFFRRHLYRALLQRIFFDKGVLSATEPLIIGSLRKQAYTSFYSYVTAAITKILNAPSEGGSAVVDGVKGRIRGAGLEDITEEDIKEYEERYKDGLKQLSIMWTLMAVCAGCVESLIVVDRWLYLRESGKCRVVRVESAFEYAVSPRNLVVVGVK